MADYLLDTDDLGIYEEPLAAGDRVSVQAVGVPYLDLTFAHHGGTAPLYVSEDPDITPRDPRADIVFVDGTVDRSYARPGTRTFWLTAAADLTFSVTRRPHQD